MLFITIHMNKILLLMSLIDVTLNLVGHGYEVDVNWKQRPFSKNFPSSISGIISFDFIELRFDLQKLYMLMILGLGTGLGFQ